MPGLDVSNLLEACAFLRKFANISFEETLSLTREQLENILDKVGKWVKDEIEAENLRTKSINETIVGVVNKLFGR